MPSKSCDNQLSYRYAKSVNILGQKYDVKFKTEAQDPKLSDVYGYTDPSTHTIVMAILANEGLSVADPDVEQRELFRHECVHAFLRESGLDSCSWADDEEIVDWIARQFPKMLDVFIKARIER